MLQVSPSRSLVVVGLLLVCTSGEAQAVTRDFLSYCKAGSLRTCASVQVETANLAGGGMRVFVRVRNLQGLPGSPDNISGPSALYQVEIEAEDDFFEGLGASNLSVSTTGGATGSGAWDVDLKDDEIELNASGSGLEGAIFGCDVSGVSTPYYQTCAQGSWVEFSFDMDGQWDIYDSRIKGIEWEVAAAGYAEIECETWSSSCSPYDPAVVPEPVTMILLGTGLAGIGGVGLARRRRQGTTIEG